MSRRRALTVCVCTGCTAHPGSCPALVASGRCPRCGSVADQQRGTRQQRGYGRDHDRARAQLMAAFVPGTKCPVCDEPMLVGQPLDAGHTEDLRTNPNARADRLEHARCNRGWRARTSPSVTEGGG